MKQLERPVIANLALAAAVLGAPVQAQETMIKLGVIRYDTHARTNGISGIGIPPGADASVGDATTLVLTAERRFGGRYGAELVMGVPPRIRADASGSVAFLGPGVLSARNVAPTLLFNWHLGQAGDRWRPYLGAGINWTRFTDVQSRLAPKVQLGDSLGPAVHAGIDYAIDKQWGAYASIAALRVKSKLVATGPTVLTSTIDFRPLTYSAGLSYRF
jgi:outer membrane protein